jgi:hypothetical protein
VVSAHAVPDDHVERRRRRPFFIEPFAPSR